MGGVGGADADGVAEAEQLIEAGAGLGVVQLHLVDGLLCPLAADVVHSRDDGIRTAVVRVNVIPGDADGVANADDTDLDHRKNPPVLC